MNGLDLEGNDGKELFHTVSIDAEVNQTNLGNTSANIIISDFRKVNNEQITLPIRRIPIYGLEEIKQMKSLLKAEK